MRLHLVLGCVLGYVLCGCSSDVRTPAPLSATLVADYGGACWIDATGVVRCEDPSLNLSGLESGVKALYGSPCASGACAEKLDGTFLCWDSAIVPPTTPGALSAPAGRRIVSVARGKRFMCMLLDDGSVACRGGFAAGGETQVVGVEDNGTIAGLTGKKATQIAAGTGHACARIEDGSVVCWGTNDFAELGLSGTVASPGLAVSVAPGVSSLPAKVAQVGAGEHFSCARTDGGEVYCWGAMTHADHASSPARVAGLPPVIDMGVAEHNVCARAYDDALWCWGDDLSGQSGVHPTVDSVPPTKLEGVNGVVTELAPSSLAYYARTLDGKVWAWGNTGSKTSFPHVIGR